MSIKLYNDTCVLRTQTIIGDWSNGMIGVSKTFGGSSILSSPACEKALKTLYLLGFRAFFFFRNKLFQSVSNCLKLEKNVVKVW